MTSLRSINEIENAMKNNNPDEWITFAEIDWMIEQVKQLELVKQILKIAHGETLSPIELDKIQNIINDVRKGEIKDNG